MLERSGKQRKTPSAPGLGRWDGDSSGHPGTWEKHQKRWMWWIKSCKNAQWSLSTTQLCCPVLRGQRGCYQGLPSGTLGCAAPHHFLRYSLEQEHPPLSLLHRQKQLHRGSGSEQSRAPNEAPGQLGGQLHIQQHIPVWLT